MTVGTCERKKGDEKIPFFIRKIEKENLINQNDVGKHVCEFA